jgi:hypothetical protein
MKRLSGITAAAASLATALVVAAPSSNAEPTLMDPQVPNGKGMWCQGGMGNVMLQPFCKGFLQYTVWWTKPSTQQLPGSRTSFREACRTV